MLLDEFEDDCRLIPLTEVPSLELMPRKRGRKLHVSTVFRWATRGVGGHRLRVVKIGGGTFTTAEWLKAFFEQLSAGNHTNTSAAAVVDDATSRATESKLKSEKL